MNSKNTAGKKNNNWLINRLNQPLPNLREEPNNWGIIIGVSIFISLFLLFFQPFGLAGAKMEYKELFIIGYGGVTLVVLTLFTVLIKKLLSYLFPVKQWTVWKHIIWLTILLLAIGTGNYLYTFVFIDPIIWNWKVFFLFQLFTIIIGLIPVSIITLYSVNQKLKKNLAIATNINQEIKHKEVLGNDKHEMVTITGKNKGESLTIAVENISFICSEGNYVRIYYKSEAGIENRLLRNTLNDIKLQMQSTNSIVQCHRAYLVNTAKITKAEGNAQGFKLSIKEFNKTIPVSRKYVPLVKKSILV
jgi:hypothetical protein